MLLRGWRQLQRAFRLRLRRERREEGARGGAEDVPAAAARPGHRLRSDGDAGGGWSHHAPRLETGHFRLRHERVPSLHRRYAERPVERGNSIDHSFMIHCELEWNFSGLILCLFGSLLSSGDVGEQSALR